MSLLSDLFQSQEVETVGGRCKGSLIHKLCIYVYFLNTFACFHYQGSLTSSWPLDWAPGPRGRHRGSPPRPPGPRAWRGHLCGTRRRSQDVSSERLFRWWMIDVLILFTSTTWSLLRRRRQHYWGRVIVNAVKIPLHRVLDVRLPDLGITAGAERLGLLLAEGRHLSVPDPPARELPHHHRLRGEGLDDFLRSEVVRLGLNKQ